MGNTVLIIGESGTGKSTSIRNLDPEETFIVNVLNKPLPFRGYKNYSLVCQDNPKGNYYSSDKAAQIVAMIKAVNERRPEIKTLVIDDFQYIMANEYMRKAKEQGFQKFVDIGQQAWNVINECVATRPDLDIFILSHSEIDTAGRSKCKTIGKMLDEKITVEGMFTVVLHSFVYNSQYKFITQNDGHHTAKSPIDMFSSAMIDNDLLEIKNKIADYYSHAA